MSYPLGQAAPRVDWRETSDGLRPIYVDQGREVEAGWAPQPGSQVAFLSCPVFECLYEGTRGGGKTDTLLMDFCQHVGKGWGREWRGVLFRRTYPELQDVTEKSLKWFKQIFPQAGYNRGEHYWTWPDGEQLYFRHFAKEQDYWSYHGHAYPWIGWEELCTWPDNSGYLKMFSCARSTAKGIPIRVRSTANPYGVGHNWVKARWRLPLTMGRIVGPVIRDAVDRSGHIEPERVAIHSDVRENKVLLSVDPDYISRLRASARNDAELKAWLHGDWNIVAGGMFDDLWDPSRHVVPDLPFELIPRGWEIDRSYDHGQTRPFSVGWWARSNGEPVKHKGLVYGKHPGDVIRIAEWYGWNGQPNEGVRMLASEIAQGIVEKETEWGIRSRVRPGPADSSIYDDSASGGASVADDMSAVGVQWKHADKGPGSRKQGWQQIRKMLKAALDPMREEPGLFITEQCQQFIRTVPALPRADRDLDDVNTEAEDHIGDETRYRLRHKRKVVAQGRFR